MKEVSFKVAKAIKEAGYPQVGYYWYSPQGVECYSESDLDEVGYVSAPTYIDVWLWLWREKGIPIQIDYAFCGIDCQINDPEEAIISAIEYLADNDLIK